MNPDADHPLILNLGCGNFKSEDEIGIDIIQTKAADVICDIGKCALPFADSAIDAIRSRHFFEHIGDIVSLMDEVYRLLKHDGILAGSRE